MRPEQYLIEYCSATLAYLKPANLFRFLFSDEAELKAALSVWRRAVEKKGIEVHVVKQDVRSALIYVVRRSMLEKLLENGAVKSFVRMYGYEEMTFDRVLQRMRMRMLLSETFPHEIGIFLGYPLQDVKAFIQYGGKNGKCVGCWMVYCDEEQARACFARFETCKRIYRRLFEDGRTIPELTVAG